VRENILITANLMWHSNEIRGNSNARLTTP
jgi:hypothetical protein